MKRNLTITTVFLLVAACSQNGLDAEKAAYQQRADQKLSAMTKAVSRRFSSSAPRGARMNYNPTSDFFAYGGGRRPEQILMSCVTKLRGRAWDRANYSANVILAWRCSIAASQGLYLPTWMAGENSQMGQHQWAYLNAFGRNVPYQYFAQEDFFVLNQLNLGGGFMYGGQ